MSLKGVIDAIESGLKQAGEHKIIDIQYGSSNIIMIKIRPKMTKEGVNFHITAPDYTGDPIRVIPRDEEDEILQSVLLTSADCVDLLSAINSALMDKEPHINHTHCYHLASVLYNAAMDRLDKLEDAE